MYSLYHIINSHYIKLNCDGVDKYVFTIKVGKYISFIIKLISYYL